MRNLGGKIKKICLRPGENASKYKKVCNIWRLTYPISRKPPYLNIDALLRSRSDSNINKWAERYLDVIERRLIQVV